MIFGIGEKEKASDRMATEANYNASSAQHPEEVENEFSKKPDLVKKGLEALTHIDIWTGVGAVGGLMAGGNVVAGVAVAQAAKTALAVDKEQKDVAGTKITPQDKVEDQDRLNGAWTGAALAWGSAALLPNIIPGGIVVTAAAAVAGHFIESMGHDKEVQELKEKQAKLSVADASDTYNAGMMQGVAANQNNVKSLEAAYNAPSAIDHPVETPIGHAGSHGQGKDAILAEGKRQFNPAAIAAERQQLQKQGMLVGQG